MKVVKTEPPRKFEAGTQEVLVKQKECGRIWLEDNELVTFITKSGKEHDVVGKSWGFFATQSINKRLKEHGFRTALIVNQWNRHYVVLVDTEEMEAFWAYLEKEGYTFGHWMDEVMQIK